MENSKIIPHLEKFQFSPEHRCFLQFTLFCRKICFCFWIIAYFCLFLESHCEALAPWRLVIYLDGEDSLSPLWKHFSNRWQDPIWPTFSLGSNRCKSSYDASFRFEPYLSLINGMASMNSFCSKFLCYCCLSWKGHMGGRNKIFTGCSARNFQREVIKRSHCATCKLFHWPKKTENA